MTPEQIAPVREAFPRAQPIADRAAAPFYDRLFADAPEAGPLFTADMTEQGRKPMAIIAVAAGAAQPAAYP